MHHQTRPLGFTLIELLVVIALIGLLSAVILASLNSARTKGNDAARVQDVRAIKTAMELYYDRYGKYPTGTGAGAGCGAGASGPNQSVDNLRTQLVNEEKLVGDIPQVLINDDNRYICSGNGKNYGLLVFTQLANGYCKTGVNVGNPGQGMWPGAPPSFTYPLCDF